MNRLRSLQYSYKLMLDCISVFKRNGCTFFHRAMKFYVITSEVVHVHKAVKTSQLLYDYSFMI